MTSENMDRCVYRLAYEFLTSRQSITREVVDSYLVTPPRPGTLPEIYMRLIGSIQNANLRANVIGGSIGGVDKLSRVLVGFAPNKVVEKYGDDADCLLDLIVSTLRPSGEVRRDKRSCWPQFCRAVLDGAKFLNNFSDVSDFYEWADFFDRDDRARDALPLLMERKIYGIGFALACDFLKEIGYEKFGKPDIHLRDIFVALRLADPSSNDYELLQAIGRVAESNRVTPYSTDKLFWLIGSGKFYMHPLIGKNGRIGRQKKAFIELALSGSVNPVG